MRKINRIIIHCSATKAGDDINAKTIKEWHVKGNGWSDIGYHYVIKLDGTVEKGRDESRSGAHVKGHNTDSIGICYVGGYSKDLQPEDTRTPEQKNSLKNLITELKHQYPDAEVFGHRDFTDLKSCPCFNARDEYRNI